MTAKNTKTRPARRKQATADPTILTIPETDNADELARALSKTVDGWDELEPEEQSELSRLVMAHRKRGRPVQVKLAKKPDGSYSIDTAGKSETLALLKLYEAFSANSIDPVNARANELLRYLGSVGAGNDGRYNAALSFIESMKPQDQAEALLLVQMYCTHDAAIRALSQLGSADWVPTVQTFGNLATKLLRTSQGQMETLARMRRGGEQVVKHIHVDNRGGQAVIAENVNQGGGKAENEDQCHGAGNTSSGTALLGQDAQGNGVPISGSEREAAMQDARGHKPRTA